jgi:hypothetical protein
MVGVGDDTHHRAHEGVAMGKAVEGEVEASTIDAAVYQQKLHQQLQ